MFDEPVFIKSLIERQEDARRFSQIFKSKWLKESEYAPILETVYDFTKENGEPPSVSTIRKLLINKDVDAYNLRYKTTLDALDQVKPDRSEMIMTLGQANDVAISRSLSELVNSEEFLVAQQEAEGSLIVESIQDWLMNLSYSEEDKTLNLKQAIEHLVQSTEFDNPNVRIPCGIKPIDDWTGGGLRKKNLGIIIAPTGAGKSVLLLIMAYKMATIERKNVWIVTNELVMEEVTERALARMTGIEVGRIMDDPTIAYRGLDHQWKQGLDKRIHITEYTRETSTDDLEADLEKLKNLYGWKPDVIVVDYMERMRPTGSGHRRDKEWGWMGSVAKDLVRLAKKKNCLVWTAAQMNRTGLNAPDMNLGMAQGSIRHAQEAHAVIGARQEDIPNSDDVAMVLQAIKMRQSRRSSKPVRLKCDLSRMHIMNEEIEEFEEEDEDNNTNALTPAQKQKRKKKK